MKKSRPEIIYLPYFLDRYRALSRHAAELRDKDSTLKTQIRFVEQDIGLFTKTKGTEDPFTEMNMENLQTDLCLPPVDFSIKWSMKPDKEPWRRVSPDKRTITLKSLGGKPIHSSQMAGKPDQQQSQTTNSVRSSNRKKFLSAESSNSEGSDADHPSTGKSQEEGDMDTSL